MTALNCHDLTVELGGRPVLTGVSAKVARGAFAVVCGPNGAGKTTLLKASLGVVKPSGGQVLLDGANPSALSPEDRARRAGYLPQERRIAWGVPALSIAALGAVTATPADADARGRAALAAVGLAGLEDRGTFEMSGGERARVLLARLFATGAPILILDEPVAGLDPDAQLLVLDLLRAKAAEGATVIATLHDLSLAARYADQVLVLHEGRLAADGAPTESLSEVVLERVFGLTGAWLPSPHGPLLAAGRRV
jgi:iron complex transport system ATP-binding protein